MTPDNAAIEVTLMDSDEVVTLVEKFKALMSALEAMKMTCHNCGEKQTLSLGVTDAIASIKERLK